MSDEQDTELRRELNQQTGKLLWKELERHFARGIVICLDDTLDLVEVAYQFKKDNAALIEQWLANGALQRATEAQAQDWLARDPLFWGIVVVPWVLVQETTAAEKSRMPTDSDTVH